MDEKRKPIPNSCGDDDYAEGYMCLTDFECEIGSALGGNIIYSSIEDLRLCRGCVDECGIVKVKVEAIELIQENAINK